MVCFIVCLGSVGWDVGLDEYFNDDCGYFILDGGIIKELSTLLKLLFIEDGFGVLWLVVDMIDVFCVELDFESRDGLLTLIFNGELTFEDEEVVDADTKGIIDFVGLGI